MKHLLRIAGLDRHELGYLLDRADRFKAHPLAAPGLLRGRTVLMYFARPSLRTRVAIETAVARLGGVPLTVGPAELRLGRGERLGDTARVIGSYAAVVVLRTFDDAEVVRFAQAAHVPVINALTDGHHPLQALADLMTLREHVGDLRGRKLAYVGPATNVTHSLIEAAALTGMTVAVAAPDGHGPDPAVLAVAEELSGGGRTVVTPDPYEAVKEADAVCAGPWPAFSPQAAVFAPYRVTADLLAAAGPRPVFLHHLPALRGAEAADEVVDGPASLVFPQAANRLPVAQAVLETLLTNRLAAAR
ncbi:ornithine carbamoyltransferase [Actinomadura sp. ATCC 31491]|uniref:Ornithine carbamoyltransferase n=1 Tax=Actinomadura luzonensis TaxID=2805427 RepID=A0ABT0FU61_9ACTN|nr:ornithine carbamoyltransferase [Actinomadura luzonensis]MCK2215876.1 ornithine carbamoyltransferase [Actinomadura luzonensis]